MLGVELVVCMRPAGDGIRWNGHRRGHGMGGWTACARSLARGSFLDLVGLGLGLEEAD